MPIQSCAHIIFEEDTVAILHEMSNACEVVSERGQSKRPRFNSSLPSLLG